MSDVTQDKHFFIKSALEKAYQQLPNYSYLDVLYSVLEVLNIEGRGKLLKISAEEFYEAVFEAIRNQTEEEFTEEELENLNSNKVKFNNSKGWRKVN